MIKQVVAGLVGLLGGLAAQEAQAQALPTPIAMARGLDLECYRTPGPALNINVNLTHLNPVLIALGLPAQQVTVRELAQTCVPVRKNNSAPAPAALPFIQHVDFACYRVDAAPLANPQPLVLSHLNPVLANLPQHQVTLERPAQLCVPVAKNGVLPPPAVLAFVQFFDLACWQLDAQQHPQFAVGLTQLNPQLVGIAPHPMTLGPQPRQLCVPVRKNGQMIPAAVRNVVQWLDLEKFAAVQSVKIAPVNVVLQHLNPLFVNLAQIPVILDEAVALLVPVAKNGQIPPD